MAAIGCRFDLILIERCRSIIRFVIDTFFPPRGYLQRANIVFLIRCFEIDGTDLLHITFFISKKDKKIKKIEMKSNGMRYRLEKISQGHLELRRS